MVVRSGGDFRSTGLPRKSSEAMRVPGDSPLSLYVDVRWRKVRNGTCSELLRPERSRFDSYHIALPTFWHYTVFLGVICLNPRLDYAR
jgi:hypothetical protein